MSKLLSVRVLPLGVAAIVVTTAIPVELRSPLRGNISLSLSPWDVLANIVLYAPLGTALFRHRIHWVIAGSAAASALIETLQLFTFGRFPAPSDVVANVVGAGLGCLMGRLLARRTGWQPDVIPVKPLAGLGSALLILVLAYLLSPSLRTSDFSNWDPDFQLALGDELTHDRPWKGRISELAIFAEALSATAVRRLMASGLGSIHISDPGFPMRPVYALDLRDNLDEIRGRPLLNRTSGREFFHTLTHRNALTILIRFRPANLSQDGPARIVTYSKNRFERNFTIGQSRQSLIFRLRTPASGLNGNDPEARTPPVLSQAANVLIAATFDGQVSRIYVDGALVGRANLAAAACPFPSLCDTGLPTVTALIGLLLAVTAMTLISPRSMKVAWALGTLAGVASATIVLVTGGAGALPDFWPWIPAISLLGGLTMSVAVVDVSRRGLWGTPRFGVTCRSFAARLSRRA
jgi:hypothetical protein